MWNENEKPEKKSEIRVLGKDKWYNQMEQVETGWSTCDRWNRDWGFSGPYWVEQDGTGTGGSSDLVELGKTVNRFLSSCNSPLVPKWDYKAMKT